MPGAQGPRLPYSVVAGVAPTELGWLVASAKLRGATFAPEEPRLFDSFREVLDGRPAFTIIVVNVPIGSPDESSPVQRTCDREARALLQGRVWAGVPSPWTYLPSTIDGDVGTRDGESDFFQARRDEVALEISPSSQRVVYEGHPDLSFYQLNGYEVPSWSHDDLDADDQRRAMLELKIPGVARVLDVEGLGVSPRELIDVAALMWTARRVFGHSAARLPSEGEWDARGLRMELVM